METKPENVVQEARIVMGFTLKQVAQAIGSNEPSVSRIERGQQMGRRETYRALHKFYGKILTLGEIYDPTYHKKRLDTGRKGQLRELAESHLTKRRVKPRPGR